MSAHARTLASLSASDAARDVTEEVGGAVNVERLRWTARDFRSDTLTIPSDAQLLAGLQATRGDDVYGEDATTVALESRLAALTGKEAALFCASGTMSNQLAIRATLTSPPHSVIADHRAHVHIYEAGGIAMFSQATTHALVPSNGRHLTAADVERALVLGDDVHTAPTRLVCLENTMNGAVFPQNEARAIADLAHKHGIKMHLDGARVWNAAAKVVEERGIDAESEEVRASVITELVEPFDSASLCLSKGIGAPVGSAIVGSKDLIKRARWFRKAFGGGWRQAGSLSAAADYALTHHFPRVAGTHALARRLASGLEAAGCRILAPVDTNMVFFDPPPGVTLEQVIDALGALTDPIVVNSNRCVTHHQTSPEAVDEFVLVVKALAEGVPEEKRVREDNEVKLGY